MSGLDALVVAVLFLMAAGVLGFDQWVKHERSIGRAQQQAERRRLRDEIERQP